MEHVYDTRAGATFVLVLLVRGLNFTGKATGIFQLPFPDLRTQLYITCSLVQLLKLR